jgi:S1-C subfamily serine protease
MRSRKLDRAIDLQSDKVTSLARAAEPFGWLIALVGTVIGVFIIVNAPEGDAKASITVVLAGIGFIVVAWGFGLVLALLARLGVLQALMAESSLISARPAKVKARQNDVTHFGASIVARPDGLKVLGVDVDGPAHYAGLAIDDLIVGVAGLESLTVEDFTQFVQVAPADTVLTLTVLRGSEHETIEITLD